jgi:hypothetical protein
MPALGDLDLDFGLLCDVPIGAHFFFWGGDTYVCSAAFWHSPVQCFLESACGSADASDSMAAAAAAAAIFIVVGAGRVQPGWVYS